MEGKGCDRQRKRDPGRCWRQAAKGAPAPRPPSRCCAQSCGADVQKHKAVRALTHNPPPGIYPGNHSPRTPATVQVLVAALVCPCRSCVTVTNRQLYEYFRGGGVCRGGS